MKALEDIIVGIRRGCFERERAFFKANTHLSEANVKRLIGGLRAPSAIAWVMYEAKT